jgi:hypothetical protein
MFPTRSVACFVLLCAGMVPPAAAQPPGINYDESRVPEYTLPDPLVCEDGTVVDHPELWREKRRPEILELFQTQVYGRSPGRPAAMTW